MATALPTLTPLSVPETTGHPASCLWCRTAEPSSFLVSNNHTSMGIHAGHCMAQHLTRNHVTYHAKRLIEGETRPTDTRDGQPLRYIERRTEWVFANGEPITDSTREFVDWRALHPLSSKGRECEREQLARAIDRAAELWSHMPDTEWLDDGRTVLAATAPPPVPDHHQVQIDADDVAMFEVPC